MTKFFYPKLTHIYIYISKNTFEDHVISRKHQISEQTVQWEQQQINKCPTQ